MSLGLETSRPVFTSLGLGLEPRSLGLGLGLGTFESRSWDHEDSVFVIHEA